MVVSPDIGGIKIQDKDPNWELMVNCPRAEAMWSGWAIKFYLLKMRHSINSAKMMDFLQGEMD